MKEQILEVYNLGLEKYAGDHEKAKEFTIGFMKEASVEGMGMTFTKAVVGGLGAGVAGLGLGLGMHGIASALNAAGSASLHQAFQSALAKAMSSNPVLSGADKSKVNSYAETIFKFAPHVACDPNLLSSILANAVHGEGLDTTTMRTLADLDSLIQETRKSALFTPKYYTK